VIDLSYIKIFFSPLVRLVDFLLRLSRQHHPALIPVPKKTIILVRLPQDYACSWGNGSQGLTQGMLIIAQFHATNYSRYDVEIPIAYFRRWFKKTKGFVSVYHPVEDSFGSFPIPAGGSSDIYAHFFVAPPFKKNGKSFYADIIFTDQFKNDHTVWREKFKSTG